MRLVYGKWKTRVWYVTPCIGMHSMNKSRAIGIWWLRMELSITFKAMNNNGRNFNLIPFLMYRDTYFNEYVIGWLIWHKKINSTRNNPPKWE